MLTRDARSIARTWVRESIAPIRGYLGAAWHGSIIDLADDHPFDPASDIDLLLIFESPAYVPVGKQHVDGLMLDISVVDWTEITDSITVLCDHNLAPSLRSTSALEVEDVRLEKLMEAVNQGFAERRWVVCRCQSAISRMHQFLDSLSPDRPLAGNAMGWLFGKGVTTHVLLVAALRNPTVRKRYLASNALLREYGFAYVQEELLELQGSAAWSPTKTEHHLAALEPAFDAVASVLKTPVPYGNDLGKDARSIAIGGSRELIEDGYHREAVFWIAATWARCMTVFHNDAPELEHRFGPDFQLLLDDLGVPDLAAMQQRADEVRAYLPRLHDVAELLMDATQEIRT